MVFTALLYLMYKRCQNQQENGSQASEDNAITIIEVQKTSSSESSLSFWKKKKEMARLYRSEHGMERQGRNQ
jgi:hypothetical protein